VVNAATMPPVLTRQFRTTLLSRTPFYRIERLESLADADLAVITQQRPACWMVLAGQLRMDDGLQAGPWQTLLMPASAEGRTARLDAGTVLLRAMVPDPMDRWLA